MIVTPEDWLIARKALLRKEEEEIGLRDEINGMRLKMPRVKIEKDYSFDAATGRKRLSDLFDGRSQLIIYHFMYGPDWSDGCLRCSFVADHINGGLVHLNNHDVTWTAVSRAPLAKIEAYKKRMGWTFPWVSSFGTEFNHDFNVSFTPEEMASGWVSYNYGKVPSDRVSDEMSGLSSFIKDADGTIFHTYSAYQRSLESLGSALMALDRAPLGRNETSSLSFVRRHDEYAAQ